MKRRLIVPGFIAILVLCFACSSFGQTKPVTGHSDNQRTGAYTEEFYLTPANVNPGTFGFLFNYSIDYQALAQPLYVPNVTLPGLGTHNVVYVATMADSVYAFDADGRQTSPLWWVNFTNPAAGITTASVATKTLPCASTEGGGQGFTQEGIVGTPAIDTSTGTMYLVAKTLEQGTVRHHLHALDITTGAEKPGSPVLISASSVSKAGHQMTFTSLHQKNRPGLLLLNGIVYLAFGSNGCNDHNSGWILSYDATTLQQVGVFNTSPDHGLASIWQTGNGIAADEAGNLLVETAESSIYDVPSGGQDYSNSVLELPSDLDITYLQYFTPSNVAYLNSNDLDMSSSGILILPDQPGDFPHEALASGKQGTIYLLNRDSLGGYTPTDSGVLYELDFAVGAMFSSPAYWNNTLYYAGDATPITAYPLVQGPTQNGVGSVLGTPFVSSAKLPGTHSPTISANGNSNGILWVMTGGTLKGAELYAMNASTLGALYNTQQNKAHDLLPNIAHFVTQTIANGKVYIATRTTLQAYGLYPVLSATSGANQSAQILTSLPNPIVFQAISPYTAGPVQGLTVSFSDGGKGGTFNPPSATTDATGSVSTTYTFPKVAANYTITASGPGIASASVTETALPGPPVRFYSLGGNKQTGTVGTVLPNPLVFQVSDAYFNGVPGITVTFTDQKAGGSFNPPSAVSNAKGLVSPMYTLPTKAGTYHPTANASGLNPYLDKVYAVAGPPVSVAVTGGNNQAAPAGTQLPQALSVVVTDQYSNPVSGVAVTFSDGGAGGSFSSPNPATTSGTGIASVFYTLPPVSGSVNVNATAAGVTAPAVFTETAQ